MLYAYQLITVYIYYMVHRSPHFAPLAAAQAGKAQKDGSRRHGVGVRQGFRIFRVRVNFMVIVIVLKWIHMNGKVLRNASVPVLTHLCHQSGWTASQRGKFTGS